MYNFAYQRSRMVKKQWTTPPDSSRLTWAAQQYETIWRMSNDAAESSETHSSTRLEKDNTPVSCLDITPLNSISAGKTLVILNTTLNGDEWSASRCDHFTPTAYNRYAPNRRLTETHSLSGREGEKECPYPYPNRTPTLQPISNHFTTITELTSWYL